MKANRARRMRGEEGGQLLLLAGIILVLAFLATSMTLSGLPDVEKQAAQEQDTRILTEYRFIREKLGSTLADAVGESTNNDTFRSLFSVTVSSLKVAASDKGYDLVIHLASGPRELGRDEWGFTHTGWPHNYTGTAAPAEVKTTANRSTPYNYRSYENDVRLDYAEGGSYRRWDENNDGIVWVKPCDLTLAWNSGDTTGCIVGAIVYIYLSDELISIEEFVAYGFNA